MVTGAMSASLARPSGRVGFMGSKTTRRAMPVAMPRAQRSHVVCMAKKKGGKFGAMGEDVGDQAAALKEAAKAPEVAERKVSALKDSQRDLSYLNTSQFYVSPAFMDKLVVHIVKNFLALPKIKVPVILGIWGGKGQGKSFQCELVFKTMGINPVIMSAGELESGNAGEPAKLLRQRYREASDVIKQGKLCVLFINDLDAGAGRLGGATQYTVNNQMVNATLMNIADNPTNVQLPGQYEKSEIPRVPIVVTGNDFATLYAPLIRDGRMEKFYWQPTREDRIGVLKGIFAKDGLTEEDCALLADTFPTQSIDFFGALRARVYDDKVRELIIDTGLEGLNNTLVKSKEKPQVEAVKLNLELILEYGAKLVREQDLVVSVKLAEDYVPGMREMDDMLSAGAGKGLPEDGSRLKAGCTDPRSENYDPVAITDDGTCEYDWETEPSADMPDFSIIKGNRAF
jgi:hypothetical protein